MDNLEYICVKKEYFETLVHLFRQTDGDVHIRLNVTTGDEFDLLLEKVSGVSKVYFSTKRSVQKGLSRHIWSKSYSCHHVADGKRCPVTLSVRIKKSTTSTLYKDKLVSEYPCLVSITGTHSHEPGTMESLRTLKICSTTKQRMFECFRSGLGPAQTMQTMSDMLSFEDKADKSQFPNSNTFYYEYNKYKADLTSSVDSRRKVKQKNRTEQAEPILFGYLNAELPKPIESLICDFPLININFQPKTELHGPCLAIITPLMSRVLQKMPQSAEMIYMETMSHLDFAKSYVTMILTWTPAGGLPVGLVITDSHDEHSYANGLKLWLENLPPSPFFGKEHPEVIMMHESKVERNALTTAFPQSRALLCQYHVMQGMWRWLWDGGNKIADEDRKLLYILFKNIMYAETEPLFDSSFLRLRYDSMAMAYPGFMMHIDEVMETKEDWALCFRRFLPARRHNTNKYCETETPMCSLIGLQRNKVANMAELARNIITTFEDDLKRRMVDIAILRKKPKHTPKSRTSIPKDWIEKDLEAGIFLIKVPTSGETHWIDPDLKICSCNARTGGKPCQHLVACENHHPTELYMRDVIVSPEDRYKLATVAKPNDRSATKRFFGVPEPKSEEPTNASDPEIQVKSSPASNKGYAYVQTTGPASGLLWEKIQETFVSVGEKLKALVTKHGDQQSTLQGLVAMERTLTKLSNCNPVTFTSALHTFGKDAVEFPDVRLT